MKWSGKVKTKVCVRALQNNCVILIYVLIFEAVRKSGCPTLVLQQMLQTVLFVYYTICTYYTENIRIESPIILTIRVSVANNLKVIA